MILKQVVIITERRRAEKISAAISQVGARYENVLLGKGTARSDVLSMLGMDSEKAVILASVTEDKVGGVMDLLVKKFRFGKGGGIAFTVPVTAVSGPASAFILSGGKVK